ncbi:MAG: dynamin family protein [Candidatus Brocadiae bacterium]|nr:dynamin family protein [Candidatus Brocadiia bacterium]
MQDQSVYQFMGKEGSLLFREEVALLEELKKILCQDSEERRLLDNLLAHIEELFLLVIVGEVKSGKSSFVNSLLGKKICKEGVTPVTDKIHILRYGEEEKSKELESFVVEHCYPFEPLKNLNIVDTPGTNSLILEHQQITEKFIPRSDLVLFITSIDRPFTESERKFLEFIKDLWGKKIIFILSKVDMKTPEEIEEVIQYIKENCKKLLDFDPILFPVSAREAFESKNKQVPELFEKSKMGAVEEYIFKTLSQGEKIKLKLSGILFNALKILDKSVNSLNKNQEILGIEKETLWETKKIISYEERILKQNYTAQVEKIKHSLMDIETWGRNFFEKNLKIAKLLLFIKNKNQNTMVDEDKLRPIPRIVRQEMEKALDILFASLQNLEVQILEIFQKKFKEKIASTGQKVSKEDCVKEIENTIKLQIEPGVLVEYSSKLLKRTQKKSILLLSSIVFAVFFGMVLKTLDISWFVNLISLGIIVSSLWAFFVLVPKIRQKAAEEYKKHVDSIGKEIRSQMEEFYKKSEQSIFAPLYSIVDKREKSLLYSENSQSQKRAEIDIFTQKAKNFQSKLSTLDSPKPAEGSL